MSTLSSQLFRIISDSFFRLLANPLARIYVDCAHRLEVKAGESARLELSETRALIVDVISSYSEVLWPEDDASADVRVKASKIFNQLLEAQWLEERSESLNERWVLISPALRLLLNMLRELATDNVSELKSFADTLESVCRDLEADGALGMDTPADGLRGMVNDLNTRLTHAIAQLHSVEKIVHGFERRQSQSQSGAETLKLLYGDFYDGQHMVCHDVLHRRGLLGRLRQASEVVRKAVRNPFVREPLAEGLQAAGIAAPGEGWRLAEEQFDRLAKGLSGIRQRADAVDARIASFNKLSQQRFFYQSQMRGRRPEMARQLCAAINSRFAGRRFSDIDEESFNELIAPWRGLLVVDVKVFHGTASLSMPRRVRQPVSLELSDAKLAAPDEAELQRLKEQMRVALTPERAACIILRLVPEASGCVSTQDITLSSEEELLDLMAAASFNKVRTADGTLRWRTILAHASDTLERDDVPRDAVADWHVERFTLTRIP
jgi:hypothetical protein